MYLRKISLEKGNLKGLRIIVYYFNNHGPKKKQTCFSKKLIG